MNREEFLRRLRAELVNHVSESVIQNQLNYYYNYIEEGIRAGKPESSVLEELSDVRLIARSIIDAAEAGGDRVAVTTPFRYSDEDINYNTDEEDLRYQGAHEDSTEDREPFVGGKQRSEHENGGQESRAFYEGQSVEDSTETGDENAFQRLFRGGPHVYQMGNAGCLITAVILFFLLYGLMALLGGIFKLLSPVLMPLLVVLVLLWFFKGMMDR